LRTEASPEIRCLRCRRLIGRFGAALIIERDGLRLEVIAAAGVEVECPCCSAVRTIGSHEIAARVKKSKR
jgi:hypothetical protein